MQHFEKAQPKDLDHFPSLVWFCLCRARVFKHVLNYFMDHQDTTQDHNGSESGDPTGQSNSSNVSDSKFTPVKSGLQKLNKSFTFEGSLKRKTSSKSKMVDDLMKSATDAQRFIAW